MRDLPILEEYWTCDEKWGDFWASLSKKEKLALLAEPPLSHPDASGRGETFIPGTVEKRENVAKLLKAKGKAPDDAGFRIYLRLLQICDEASRAYAGPAPQKALATVLERRFLSTRARVHFAKDGEQSYFYLYGSQPIELDPARLGAKRRLLSFLAIPKGKPGIEWERGQSVPHRSGGDLNLFTGTVVTSLATRILEICAATDAPVPLSKIRNAAWQGEKGNIFEKSLRGLTQWGLVFAVLDEEKNLALRLWPGMHERLTQTASAPPPLPVAKGEPEEVFTNPIAAVELHALVLAASASPLRLTKKNMATLPVPKAREIGSRLPETPSWVCGDLYQRPNSLQVSLGLGLEFGYLDSVESKRYDEPLSLAASSSGRSWASLGAADRLERILSTLRKRRKEVFSSNWAFYVASGLFREIGDTNKHVCIGDALYAAWKTLPTDRWTPLEPLLDHLAAHSNPIEKSVGPEGVVRVARQSRYSTSWQFVPTDVELLEKEARDELERFLTTRLVPLGAVELGRHRDGSVSVRLNEVGRFFLGLAPGFTLKDDTPDGKVVVQPNFEVVFLGPNLAAESAFDVFAERISKASAATTGSLFRLTRASIQKAAHAGATLAEILKSIETATDKPLPTNVRTEIEGWVGGRKYYKVAPATLIRCPSREVALRVHAVLPKTTTILSDTILELSGKITAAVRRKLEKDGLFEEEAKKGAASNFDDDLLYEILRKSGMSPRHGRRMR